jgi:hypothetical protein
MRLAKKKTSTKNNSPLHALKNAPKSDFFSESFASLAVLRQNKQKTQHRRGEKEFNEEKLITVNCMKL